MKVVSVNTGRSQRINFREKSEQTGYFKTPVESIRLGKMGVEGDVVADLEHHGGLDKACYIYGHNHYAYWQQRYPSITFEQGMFGENICVDELSEATMRIGDIIKIGDAVVQISQPRQPCYKMGIRFNDQTIVNEFRKGDSPGIYVRVLTEGSVHRESSMTIETSDSAMPTVLEVYRIVYDSNPDPEFLKTLINNELLANRVKNYLSNKFKIS